MSKQAHEDSLRVPEERRSVQIVNELREKNFSNLKLGSHIYCARAKLDYPDWESSGSPMSSNVESSLGLLDLNGCRAFGEEDATRSSVGISEYVKENTDPNVRTAKNPLSQRDSKRIPFDTDIGDKIEEIVEVSESQSRAMRNLMANTSENPKVCETGRILRPRMDGGSNRSNGSVDNGERKKKNSMSFDPAEITARSTAVFRDESEENIDVFSHIGRIVEAAKLQSRAVDDLLQGSSDPKIREIRQSLDSFRASIAHNDIDRNTPFAGNGGFANFSMCSKTEMSDSNFNNQEVDLSKAELSWMREHGTLPVKPQVELDSIASSAKNPFTRDEDVSIGQYFQNKNSDIRKIFREPSPQKSRCEPLYSQSLTVEETRTPNRFGETFNRSSRLMTMNDSSGIPPIVDESSIKFSTPGIKKLDMDSNRMTPSEDVTAFDASSSNSVLSLTNIKNIVEKMTSEPYSHNIIDQVLQAQNKKQSRSNKQNFTLAGKSPFGIGPNVFHSTHHDEAILNSKDREPLSNNSSFTKPHLDKLSSESGFVSTLKTVGKSISGSSGYTESTIKSSNTVIPYKPSNVLKTICESKNLEMTPSDSSKELRDLMSPASRSGNSTPRRLINEFRFVNSEDNEGWITPTMTGVNEISRECIPAETPRRSDLLHNSGSLDSFSHKFDQSDCEEQTPNIPIKGDWIEIISNDTSLLFALPSQITMKIISLGNHWIHTAMKLKTVYVDDDEYTGNIQNIMKIEIPTSAILLKADSEVLCSIQITPKVLSKNIKLYFEFNLVDAVTKNTSKITHVFKMSSEMAKLSIRSPSSNNFSNPSVSFPVIPEDSEVLMPVIITNENEVNLALNISVSDEHGSFSISEISSVAKNDIESILSENLQLVHKNNFNRDECTSVKKTIMANSSIKLMLKLRGLSLHNEVPPKIQTVCGNLNIDLISNEQYYKITNIPIIGKIGVYRLLIRNSQKSAALSIAQGNSELVELMNAGCMNMHYDLFISSAIDQPIDVIPCEDPVFTLDKSEINLIPGEKAAITVTYPMDSVMDADVQRTLIFKSTYTTEVLQLIGTHTSRSNSQQSTYSVDSEAMPSEEISIKATKKSLSWGCVKIGQLNIQDVIFKNSSSNKKLRVIATIIGDSFKIISDNEQCSSHMFSLQPLECRALRVGFRPSCGGGHTGVLRIARRINPGSQGDNSRLLHRASLHGVGDEAVLVFKDGIFKHGATQDLPLGSLNNSAANKYIDFTVWNKGTAPGFFVFNLDLKWKYRSLQGEVVVNPNRGIINAGESMKCSVIVPRRALLLAKKNPGQTETLATLQVLHGNEATRLRIKKIRFEYLDDEHLYSAWIGHSKGKLDVLCGAFPNEDKKLGKIHLFKENTDSLKILFDEIMEKEVMVTYDVDLDHTVARLSSDLDETLKFQTMCADFTSSNIEPGV